MDKTPKLGLNLPAAADYAEIERLNENFQALDEAVGAKPDLPEPAGVKETPADGDGLLLRDSADAGALRWLLWSALKKALEGTFAAKPADGKYTPAVHAASHAKAGADPVSPAAIGAATAPTPVVVSFSTTGWVKNSATNCYEQTVACPGLLSSDDKRTTVSPVGSTDAAAQALTDAAEALVDRYACTTDGQLYARCPEKAPTVAFSVAVTIVRG